MKKILSLLIAVVISCGFSASAVAKKKYKKPVASKPYRADPAHPAKKKHVQFKSYNENNPATPSDNTITVVEGGREVDVPVKKTWNEKHLHIFQQNPDVNITSEYNPETGSYTVTNIEPFNSLR